MSPYRQWFHLHQHADSRLSETQVLAIAAKILAEHKKNLEDYKLRSVVFYPQTYGSPFPAKWQVIYYPQTPLVNGEPDTHRGVLVNVVDQTANAEYED
jgi:hypothetical protein